MTQPQQNPWDVVGIRRRYTDQSWDIFVFGERSCTRLARDFAKGRVVSASVALRNGQIIRVRPKR